MNARKKAPKKKASTGWGGSRPGSGRPVGSGTGPRKGSRTNRVVAMLDDVQLKKLTRHAKKTKQKVGTAAYSIIARSLRGMA